MDFAKLASQGRAYNASRPWETHELDALLLLERERHLARTVAADYIRNGILTLEAFDAATKAQFQPKTLEDAQEDAEKALKENEFAKLKVKEKKGKK